jgi:hypothetical protein
MAVNATTPDRFARNELRLAALARVPKRVRDTWSLGALLDADVDGDGALTFGADYAAGAHNPRLALLGDEGLTPLALPELAATPITRVDAGQTLLGAKAARVRTLLGRPELRRLRGLDLRGAKVQSAAEALSGCDALESLGLGATSLAVESLARATLPRLTHLEVRANNLDARDLLTLLTAPGLPRLDDLDAGANKITDDGFEALVESGALARLRTLTLDTGPATRVTPARWAAFANSPHVEGMRSLSVARGGAANDLDALLTAERLRGLRALSVGLAGTLRRVELPSLEHFAVTLADPESLAALLASPTPPDLRALDLTVGWYDLAALPALYRSAWCATLTSLTLRCSGFATPDDAALALDLPRLPALRALSLRCPAPTAALARLLSRFDDGALASLRIDAVEPGAMRALAASDALATLKELHVTSGRTEPDEFAALVSSPRSQALQGLTWGCSAVGPAAMRVLLDEAACARLVALSMQTTADVDETLRARAFENPRTPHLWTLTGGGFVAAPKSLRGVMRTREAPARD